MLPGAFQNCPQCHALLEDGPPAPPYAGEDAPPVTGGGEVPAADPDPVTAIDDAAQAAADADELA